ncbi:MAG TPA: type III secretion system translocon subunit SctE [Polyangiaceae bacterium LLY-WYZ-15_(1-7)]|nr:type III secretion system translocon subunit SctE [Polyangiaceae bacterium LLY-WYZ-15_(1-7)]
MAALASFTNNAEIENRTEDVQASRQDSEMQRERVMHALEKVEKALKKAANKAPRWVKKLIGAVLTAVGTVASVFSGGATLALVVVAVVLIAAGDIVDELAHRGVLDERNGAIAASVLKLVGAALMIAAGGASAAGDAASGLSQAGQAGASAAQAATTTAHAGSQAAQAGGATAQAVTTGTKAVADLAEQGARAAELASTITDLISGVNDVVTATFAIVRGVHQHRADQANATADFHRTLEEDANLETESASDALRRVVERHARIMASVTRTQQVRAEAALTVARSIA